MERKISVVIPAYNEEESVGKLYEAIMESIGDLLKKGKVYDYEIWFISDGSTDSTEEKVRDLHQRDGKVHLVAFRKNFGKALALSVGFYHATGDIVFTMDADLQDDPKEFESFIDKIDEGYDLVSGWKFNRLDPMEKKLPSRLFNFVTSKLSGITLHDFDCGFKAYRKEVVKSIDVYGEFHRYIPVLAWRKGFRIGEVKVEHHKRTHGKSKYGVERYLRGLFDSFTTTFLLHYSDRPMYFFGRIGLGAMVLGGLTCLYLTILWFMGQSIGGRPLLILGVLLIILGIQFISTGFICNLINDIKFHNVYDGSKVREIL